MALNIDATVAPFLDQYLRGVVETAVHGDVDAAIEELKRAVIAAATDDEDFFLIVGRGDPMLVEDEDELAADEAAPDTMPVAEPEAEAEPDDLRDYLGQDSVPAGEHDE